MSKNILVLVPHGDDEVLMCGGSIVKHVDNGDYVTCVFSRGFKDERTRKQLSDIEVAKKILGYHNVIYMNLSEETLCNDELTYMRKFEKINADLKPDVVYTTFWGDNHQDHKSTFNAVAMACRPWGLHMPSEIYCGEIPSSTEQSPPLIQYQFMPNYYKVLTDKEILKKKYALKAYKTELCDFPHPRSADGIELFSRKRGNECRTKFAEAFVCIRNIEK